VFFAHFAQSFMIKNDEKSDQTVHLWGISFFGSDKESLLILIKRISEDLRRTTYIMTPNPEQLVQAKSDKELQRAFEESDINIPDGIGIVWASKLLHLRGKSKPIVERIAGREFAVDLLKLATAQKWQTLVIGGRGYLTSTAGNSNNPSTLIVDGTYPVQWMEGYKEVGRPQANEEAAILATLRQLRPQLVFVAFGAPHQERWVLSHRAELEKNGVKLVMVVGGAFDYLFGAVPRIPDWVARLGFEWLHRLLTQPWRWRRQLRLLTFVRMVLAELLFS
jgi:N-acetylglucosaminyldiphosphoundecaprenol N-acetyl-beta-D-mannosaminyltransferase